VGAPALARSRLCALVVLAGSSLPTPIFDTQFVRNYYVGVDQCDLIIPATSCYASMSLRSVDTDEYSAWTMTERGAGNLRSIPTLACPHSCYNQVSPPSGEWALDGW
jgi:hypothetical protein